MCLKPASYRDSLVFHSVCFSRDVFVSYWSRDIRQNLPPICELTNSSRDSMTCFSSWHSLLAVDCDNVHADGVQWLHVTNVCKQPLLTFNWKKNETVTGTHMQSQNIYSEQFTSVIQICVVTMLRIRHEIVHYTLGLLQFYKNMKKHKHVRITPLYYRIVCCI
jgi:hypothetical protein